MLMASACRSLNKSEAAILLWDRATFKLLRRLESHRSTVTDLTFHEDLLLSVSKDRQLGTHPLTGEPSRLHSGLHSRQINFVAVSSQGVALTGSRDKTVRFTSLQDLQGCALDLADGVAAGDWVPARNLAIVGLDSGIIVALELASLREAVVLCRY